MTEISLSSPASLLNIWPAQVFLLVLCSLHEDILCPDDISEDQVGLMCTSQLLLGISLQSWNKGIKLMASYNKVFSEGAGIWRISKYSLLHIYFYTYRWHLSGQNHLRQQTFCFGLLTEDDNSLQFVITQLELYISFRKESSIKEATKSLEISK